jgi:hypothetical protein
MLREECSNKASRYVVFSIALLPCPPLIQIFSSAPVYTVSTQQRPQCGYLKPLYQLLK